MSQNLTRHQRVSCKSLYVYKIVSTPKIVNNEYQINLDRQGKGNGTEKLRNIDSDVSGLIKLKTEYPNNPNIAYLNISSVSEKLTNLRELRLKTLIDILQIDETAMLDSSYSNAKFHIIEYQFPPLRKDRNQNGGGNLVCTKGGIKAKRLEFLEGNTVKISAKNELFPKRNKE